jgi:hypothetical protein
VGSVLGSLATRDATTENRERAPLSAGGTDAGTLRLAAHVEENSEGVVAEIQKLLDAIEE